MLLNDTGMYVCILVILFYNGIYPLLESKMNVYILSISNKPHLSYVNAIPKPMHFLGGSDLVCSNVHLSRFSSCSRTGKCGLFNGHPTTTREKTCEGNLLFTASCSFYQLQL